MASERLLDSFTVSAWKRDLQSVFFWFLMATSGTLFVATWDNTVGWIRWPWLLFWLELVVLARIDWKSLRVPNLISIPSAFVFVSLGFIGGHSMLVRTMLGAMVCSGLLLIMSILTKGRGMGMGDVKLFVTIGAMLGPVLGIESLLAASCLASLIGGLLMLFGKLRRSQPFPFVPYILAGVIFAQFFAPEINHWYMQHWINS